MITFIFKYGVFRATRRRFGCWRFHPTPRLLDTLCTKKLKPTKKYWPWMRIAAIKTHMRCRKWWRWRTAQINGDKQITIQFRGERWYSGRASDIWARDLDFEIYLRRVVSLNKTLYSPKVLEIPRKWLLRPHMSNIFDCDVQPQHKQTHYSIYW